MLYKPLNLRTYKKYSLGEIQIGDTVTLHNGREGIQVKILGKNEQKELLKGEVLFYLILGSDWTKGDELIFSPNNISGFCDYATIRTY